MIKFKNITIKNFMSIGNATQAVNLDRTDLTLVLGENLDLGSNGSRNGVGKTSLINALSYALYGGALTNIKKPNLINKTNNKNMLVSVDFIKDNIEYRIERGRKPNVLRFFINDKEHLDDDAQGDSRETQHLITSVLGLSHAMFKHIVALNTYTIPFLNLSAKDQREIIEELLGITLLSEKADILRENNKDIKNQIKEEEFRIKAVKNANERIESQIANLNRKEKIWNSNLLNETEKLVSTIDKLEQINIEDEIKSHQDLIIYTENSRKITECNQLIQSIENNNKQLEQQIVLLDSEIQSLQDHKCHACGQDLHDDKQQEIITKKQSVQTEIAMQLISNQSQHEEHIATLNNIKAIDKPSTFYKSINEALKHQNSLDTANQQLQNNHTEVNPYTEQITEMKDQALQEINYDLINDLSNLQEHQDFLLKLLTNKDSFIRKSIIEQNLGYLNTRLSHYTNNIGLHQKVKFINDLSVEITELGRDLDFDNLSRGERNRVILSLSWAFRDVWESLYTPINTTFIDEVVDSGMDSAGVENSLSILKGMARERNKSLWLISHKDELSSRVNNVLTVLKEDGFTTFNNEMIY